jgi:hypothetical protein
LKSGFFLTMAGYSSTPLIKKLGIKEGFTLCFVNEPHHFHKLLLLPDRVQQVKDLNVPCDFIHVFTEGYKDMELQVLRCKKHLKQNGMLWISWPKKSSGVKTDLSENEIRNFALQHGLVDVKVCAVDDVWSGLKLVIPLKSRKRHLE